MSSNSMILLRNFLIENSAYRMFHFESRQLKKISLCQIAKWTLIPTNNKIVQPDKPKERWKRETYKKLISFVFNYWSQSENSIDNICTRIKKNSKKEIRLWIMISKEIEWGPVQKIQNRFIMLWNLNGLSTRKMKYWRNYESNSRMI